MYSRSKSDTTGTTGAGGAGAVQNDCHLATHFLEYRETCAYSCWTWLPSKVRENGDLGRKSRTIAAFKPTRKEENAVLVDDVC